MTEDTLDAGTVRLEELDRAIAAWMEHLLAAAEQEEIVDGAYDERFGETDRRLVELNEQLHPDDFDPEALAEIRGIIIQLIGTAGNLDDLRPLDAADHFLVQAEAMRHLIRDALDGHVTGAGEDAREVVRRLRHWLPQVTQEDLAGLTGMSRRHFQRLAKDGGVPPRRLELVTRLVALLHRGWTQEGTVAWFRRARPELDGRPPLDLLDDPDRERALLVAARQGRAQHGS